ncbi:MAG: hypothetical protein JWP63_1251 [Candidatus Solibacter sp.]|nr:hypothetical protein [Candidatus Solibacter sp.]
MRSVLFLLAASAYAQTVTPYSAEETSTRTQFLSDGTRVAEKTVTGHLYRDPQGRTRTERVISPGTPNETLIVEIADPAANVRYSLDTRNKIAHRAPLATTKSRVAEVVPADDTASQQQYGQESLGQRMIAGVLTEGRRIVTTILPAATSNDHLTVMTTEMWFSNTLGLTLSSTVTDPRAGTTTYSITNIALTAPDASLFQIPSDYSSSN